MLDDILESGDIVKVTVSKYFDIYKVNIFSTLIFMLERRMQLTKPEVISLISDLTSP